MSITRALSTNEEIGQRGREIYDRVLKAKLEPKSNGMIVAIDVNSADYEIGADVLDTADRLRIRRPDAEVFFVRVGDPVFHRFRSPRIMREST